MGICPDCGTFSITSDNKCLNCYGTVVYKKVSSYGFLDFIRVAGIVLSGSIFAIAAIIAIFYILDMGGFI